MFEMLSVSLFSNTLTIHSILFNNIINVDAVVLMLPAMISVAFELIRIYLRSNKENEKMVTFDVDNILLKIFLTRKQIHSEDLMIVRILMILLRNIA